MLCRSQTGAAWRPTKPPNPAYAVTIHRRTYRTFAGAAAHMSDIGVIRSASRTRYQTLTSSPLLAAFFGDGAVARRLKHDFHRLGIQHKRRINGYLDTNAPRPLKPCRASARPLSEDFNSTNPSPEGVPFVELRLTTDSPIWIELLAWLQVAGLTILA